MLIRFLLIFGFLLSSVSLVSLADNAQNNAPPAGGIEEILVVGEQPGPALWRVSKGEHVMWVLGTYTPLPQKMTWHSELVESVLENSQEVILPPLPKANIGFFKGLSLIPSMVGVKENPDGKKLNEILPPEEYAHWLILKEKYLGKNNSVEKMRPLFAAEELYQKAINKVGLSTHDEITDKISTLAKQHKITVTPPIVTFDFEGLKDTIQKFKKSSLNDVVCFEKTIARLETDLDAMRLRANAWAIGDINKLNSLPFQNQDTECNTAFLDSAVVQKSSLGGMQTRLRNAWLSDVKKSLLNNMSTFAVLPIDKFYGKEGYLDILQSEGYIVESPK